jgi:hypothetical protein
MDEIAINQIHHNEVMFFVEGFKQKNKFFQIELIQNHLKDDIKSVTPQYLITHLSNATLKEHGHRIDLVYSLGNHKKIIIQSFIDDQNNNQETTAYLVKGNELISEFFTNNVLATKKTITKNEWNGDIILEKREFEKDSMIL